MLDLLAGPDTGANSMFAQGCSVERVSNNTYVSGQMYCDLYCISASHINKLIVSHRLALHVCRGRRTVKKTLLEEVQELEARAVDPGAAVLRDASGRRYVRKCAVT